MRHYISDTQRFSSRTFSKRRFAAGTVLLFAGGLPLACGGGTPDGYGSSGSNSGATGSTAAGSAATGASASGASATSATGSSGGFVPSATTGAGSTTTGGSGDFEECAGTVSEGESLALDMYIVLDHTTSMTENTDGEKYPDNDCPLVVGATPTITDKWCFATHALASFFVNNAAPGARVALNFMAMPGYLCEGGPDNPQAHPVVDITPLPSDPAGPLITALSNDAPIGVCEGCGASTAIEAALRGIRDYALANRTPGRKMVGVLITDGDATRCNTDNDFLANLVGQHLNEDGVETYLIGMTGATEELVDAIAAQGGAPEHTTYCGSLGPTCHYWSVGDGDPTAFVDALNQIQAAALLPCSYTIPNPPAGEAIDLGLVNAEFTAATGEQIVMGHVDNAAACVSGEYQWYYDNPTSPNSLELCPDACQVATEQGEGARIRVAYGCATVTDTVVK